MMDIENNVMHVNPKHKLCKKIKKNNGQKHKKLKIFQFRSVEHQSSTNRVRQIQTKIFIAISIN